MGRIELKREPHIRWSLLRAETSLGFRSKDFCIIRLLMHSGKSEKKYYRKNAESSALVNVEYFIIIISSITFNRCTK